MTSISNVYLFKAVCISFFLYYQASTDIKRKEIRLCLTFAHCKTKMGNKFLPYLGIICFSC